MTQSPAQKYAAAKSRSKDSQGLLGSFQESLSFVLDDFQLQACRAIDAGSGVLVAAPTSAGKTVVGQFAVYTALSKQTRCFYTTPIKALSNQKFNEFVDFYGAENIGLLTGDSSINGDAPIVVMTTEVLRNMLYEDSSGLRGLSHVVMDEVHYLADRSRGAVWEEVIIHLSESVSVVALSATVSNAEEFGDWLRTVRGKTEVIVEEHRPIPLHQHVMVGDELHDLFVDKARTKVSPELQRIARNDRQQSRHGYGRGNRFRSRYTPSRVEVIEELDRAGLLPSITFIFSRAACDDAVSQCLAGGLSVTTPEERLLIRGVVDAHFPDASSEELRVLGFASWCEGLEKGIAAHHAGLLPAFKVVVEQLFQEGLVKVVFATETLALGINMPARSVVLEKLTKWNGSVHAPVTAGEYTQLTGRAGRRGIDTQGHAIVVWHNELDPDSLAGLASTRTYPLKSSFKPSYNMAINLIGKFGTHRARELLESSFAQFQADKSVVGLATQMRRNESAIDGYQEAMECHLGDFSSYMALRRQLSNLEKDTKRDGVRERRHNATNFLNEVERGDVIVVDSDRRSSTPYVVLDEARDSDDPRPRVMSQSRVVKRIGYTDVGDQGRVIGRIRIPATFDSRSPKTRNWLADQIADVSRGAPRVERGEQSESKADIEVSRLRKAIRAHVCHGCSDREEHVRWHERIYSTRREIEKLESRVATRTSSIAKEFDQICDVLTELKYLEKQDTNHIVTDAGAILGRIYCELDLLAAECLRSGVWDDLTPEQMASAVSTLVYESRRDDDRDTENIPDGALGIALTEMVYKWGVLKEIETQHRMDSLRDMDPGFVWLTLKWARGQSIARVLKSSDLQAGDFVRWSKQVIDLLGQISLASEDPKVANAARSSSDLINRGIVAW